MLNCNLSSLFDAKVSKISDITYCLHKYFTSVCSRRPCVAGVYRRPLRMVIKPFLFSSHNSLFSCKLQNRLFCSLKPPVSQHKRACFAW